ncbi:hypothetical protein AFL01nite_23270 [Aeromicrobium flavum]|uniref:Uncharacterized protein n=1 Tax=Aeromicrobium flavum TaxID=416568 RepID=A0A512HX57_9ACTN|nr:hypothetical protein [Aeromicrobium flavum]GEO90000.1 hypothetical protein AFL01nite_23270 [Aeromicrobium flavum]
MRALLAWLLPAVATFAAWWAFLGTDADGQYSVAQVLGLVVVLLLVGVACGWLARRTELLGVIVSAVVGVAVACWTDWAPDDDSGLFIVGWGMVVFGTAVFGALLVLVTSAVRRSRDQPAS